MDIDNEAVRRSVLDAVRGQPAAAGIKSVEIEADHDGDGFEFVRVLIRLPDEAAPSDEELEAILETIETAVGAGYQTYASVRFLDAA